MPKLPLTRSFRVSELVDHEYLLPNDAAKLLRCSPRKLARMRAERTGPAFAKCGGHILYRRAALHEWVAGNVIPPLSDRA